MSQIEFDGSMANNASLQKAINDLQAQINALKITAGAAAGSNTDIQFNDSGLLGGNNNLTYAKTTKVLTMVCDAQDPDGVIILNGPNDTFQMSNAHAAWFIGLTPDISGTPRVNFSAYDPTFTTPIACLIDSSKVALSSLSASQVVLTDASKNLVSAGAKPTVTGSKGANAALASLMTALAGLGIVTDSTT